MDEFEKMLDAVHVSVERFIRYRMPSQTDADDVLQEVYLSAYRKFPQLKNKEAFKPWIISIARNKCNDYFRAKAAQMEISIEELTRKEFVVGRRGVSVVIPCGKRLTCWATRISRSFTCISGRKCPKRKLQSSWTYPLER